MESGNLVSTLVEFNDEETRLLFTTEEYINAARHICVPGREGVNAANLRGLLDRRQNVKNAVKCGVDKNARKAYWLATGDVSGPGDRYRASLRDVSEQETSVEQCPEFEEFGWLQPTQNCRLRQRVSHYSPQRRILYALKNSHPYLSYCPLLPVLVTLTTNFLEEAECFNILDEILHRPDWLCRDHRENLSSIHTLVSLFKTKCKHACQQILKHNLKGKDADVFLSAIMASWREWIFCNQPFWFMIRILDVFFEVGPKVLYRLALGCLIMYVDRKLQPPGVGVPVNISLDIPLFMSSLQWSDRGAWFKLSNSIKLSRKQAKQLFFSELADLLPSAEPHPIKQSSETKPFKDEVEVPFTMTEPMISSLTGEHRHWKSIWSWIPEWARIMHPQLLYKPASDGYNLRSMYRKASDQHPLLLLLKTKNDEIIGAFISNNLEERKLISQSKFFGNGETSIFSLEPLNGHYSWTGKSDFVLMAQENEFAIGAGGGSFGIWMDGDLNHGSSSPCTAFDNPPLVESGQFDIVNLNLFALLY